jgi:hypothetical protein
MAWWDAIVGTGTNKNTKTTDSYPWWDAVSGTKDTNNAASPISNVAKPVNNRTPKNKQPIAEPNTNMYLSNLVKRRRKTLKKRRSIYKL